MINLFSVNMSNPLANVTPEDVRNVFSSSVRNNLKVFKVIVLGDSNVGKTSLTYRFCEGSFLEAVEATIGVDFRERSLKIDGEDVKVNHAVCSLRLFELFL